ncbi:glycosyltransferase family 2 protein [Paenibacillus pasadenensis]|uniref:glycosyltransferase family 2 protein n=1 Tax=Paenibacillus pasadenensis TaxID=217090 RepID=UPI0020422B30|nr:glycosyltransferase family 2 protein [Paenibacillus pasadenensis]MCM3747648.1 glycosyltransferase family 2 protein [Paenibacillus pasadenensis]
MSVTIVIPNFNGEQYIETCLDSLNQQIYKDFDVIFVDNGSSDCSLTLIRKKYSEVKIVELDKNLGFSAAVNLGIKLSRSKYVVLLNTDTKALDNWLEELVGEMERQPDAFSCSSKMLQYNHPDLIDDAGDEFTAFGFAYQAGHGKSSNLYTECRKVFSACAGAAIYRREFFDEIGYFDERFFAYMEDVDLGFRARVLGYENIYCPTAIIYHIGSATSGGGINSFKLRLTGRNTIFLLKKNMPLLLIALNIPFLLTGILLRLLLLRDKPRRKAYWEGILLGWRERRSFERVKGGAMLSREWFQIEWRLIRSSWMYIRNKLILSRRI